MCLHDSWKSNGTNDSSAPRRTEIEVEVTKSIQSVLVFWPWATEERLEIKNHTADEFVIA